MPLELPLRPFLLCTAFLTTREEIFCSVNGDSSVFTHQGHDNKSEFRRDTQTTCRQNEYTAAVPISPWSVTFESGQCD